VAALKGSRKLEESGPERERGSRKLEESGPERGGASLHAPAAATRDALFGGRIVLYQPARGSGYRTNVDALLLADFAASGKTARVAFDLGAGVGAVGLALIELAAARHVVFVEIDERAAEMAQHNLDANGWTARGEVVCGDAREIAFARRGEAALVVCNPPYVAPGRGRVARAQERARSGEVDLFVEAARQLAGRKARVCLVYPAPELATLLGTLAAAGLHAKRVRFVHGTPDAAARVALVEAQAGRPGGLRVLLPLVERTLAGYTPEMKAILRGEDIKQDQKIRRG
jgi:tRNA1Val (adenine37-N6)-methyltransferase